MSECVSGARNGGHCDVDEISSLAIGAAANDTLIAALSRASHHRCYKAGQSILTEDTPVDLVGTIVSGVVKLTKFTLDGRQQIVGLLFPSDLVGRSFIDRPRFSAEAATDVELCCLQKAAFERLLAENPAMEHQLLIWALDELDAARDWMLLLGRKSAGEKVASFLLTLVSRGLGSPTGETLPWTDTVFELPVSRVDMAGYLGTAVETVSRQLSKFRAAGVIRFLDTHHFSVLDLGRLAGIAGDEPPASIACGHRGLAVA